MINYLQPPRTRLSKAIMFLVVSAGFPQISVSGTVSLAARRSGTSSSGDGGEKE